MALQNGIEIPSKHRSLENYHLIWLDPSSNNYQSSLSLFQKLLHSISYCSNLFELNQLLPSLIDVKIFLILSDSFDDEILSHLDAMDTIYCIYLLSSREEAPTKHSGKLQGIFSDSQPLYEFIRRDVRQFNHDFNSIQILPFDQTDLIYQSTSLLREILVTSESNDQIKQNFLDFILQCYSNNLVQLALIDEYTQCIDYRNASIQWYMKECFFYALIQRALRIKDFDLLGKLAFFIGDLHRQIDDVHRKSTSEEKLIVYYGQGMSMDAFERLKSHANGLIIFETFLCTTIDREISDFYARQSGERANIVPVLFQIEIDRTKSSFPFVRLNSFDFYQDTDQHVLFSLNPTFRIGSIQLIDNQIWQVTLSLIDPIDKPVLKSSGFFSLAKLMLEREKHLEAKDIYEMELERTLRDDYRRLADIHRNLGLIYQRMQQFPSALSHYERSLKIRLDYLPSDDRLLAPSFVAVGTILEKLGRSQEAIEYLQRAIQYSRKRKTFDPQLIATYYLDLGRIFLRQGGKSQARETLQSALRYEQKCSSSPSERINKIQRYIALTE